MSTIEATQAPVTVLPSEIIIRDAAKALDDRKSKLAFAKQVEKSRNEGTTDDDFATALLEARVRLAFGDTATVEQYGKDFQMSASKVSQYGTTMNQLRAAKAPLTEDTFADWFKLTATGGSAKVRNGLIADLTDEENADLTPGEKANVIRAAREAFIGGKSAQGSGSGEPRRITLDGVYGFLERLVAQEWDDTDREEIEQALFDAAAALNDKGTYSRPVADPVDAEQVAA